MTRTTGWRLDDQDHAADLCLHRGELRTILFHDPCIANIPDVLAACCGHGQSGTDVYVYGGFGYLDGPGAALKMKELGGRPPAAAFADLGAAELDGGSVSASLGLNLTYREVVELHFEGRPGCGGGA